MRRFILLGFSVVVVFAGTAQEFECGSDLSATWEERRIEVNLPLGGIIAEIIEKLVGEAIPSVTLTWTLDDTLRVTLDCGCPVGGASCCSGPSARAYAELNLYQVLAPPPPLGRTTYPQPGSTFSLPVASNFSFNPGHGGFGGKNLCRWPGAVTVSVKNYTGRVGLTAGLEWLLKVSTTRVSINADEICRCNPSAGCLEATGVPRLYIDNQLVVPEGGFRDFAVRVDDPDKDVVAISASGAEVLSHIPDDQGRIVGAVIRVPATSPEIRVMAEDFCGHASAISKEVLVVHPPKVEVKSQEWVRKGHYFIQGWIVDEDMISAKRLELEERVTVGCAFVSSGGGAFKIGPHPHPVASTIEVLETDFVGSKFPFAAEYIPPKRGAPRVVNLFIYARDAWGFEGHWSTALRNEPATVEVSWTSPASSSAVRVKRGEEVQAWVAAEDPEGLDVVLTKLRGPGEFPRVAGEGRVEGLYRWIANTAVPWNLVTFFAEDPPFEGGTTAHLLIHVLQPPRAHDGQAWVRRGGATTTYIYVDDPDSFSHTFLFSPPKGIAVRVVGKDEAPEYYGEHWGHLYQVEVQADKALCDGVYPVSFTVADPDGLSSSGTLYVRVVGNRAPLASPIPLVGETTVTLTPTGVVMGPVVVRGEVLDPDGDQVFVEAPGMPPQYAGSLSYREGVPGGTAS
ncbi:MAG: hypothetical protein ACP5LK_00925 [Candidatus Bipolaricaulaceae bacterium]